MVPVVLHTANAVTARALRPPNRMAPSLRGDDLPLNARQQQLRFGQGQTQIGNIAEIIGPSDLQNVRAWPLALSPDLHQPQHPSHASTLGQRTNAKIPDRPPHPQSCDGPGLDREHVRLAETGAMRLLPGGPAPAGGTGRVAALQRSPRLAACPVRALQDWLLMSDCRFGPVFRSVDRWGNVGHRRLTADGLRRIGQHRARGRPRARRTGPGSA